MNKIYLLLCLSFSLTTIAAQSLIDQLGGISTNFVILVDDEPVEVASQYIIQRMKRGSESAGASYHFEFALRNIPVKDNHQRSRTPFSNRIVFLDGESNVIGTMNTAICQLRLSDVTEASALTCFNFDLVRVPLSVLQHCRTIQLSYRL